LQFETFGKVTSGKVERNKFNHILSSTSTLYCTKVLWWVSGLVRFAQQTLMVLQLTSSIAGG
jgi:hypothetical protein